MEHLREKALEYHKKFPHGKIEVISTKETVDADDLSLAYSPGVAFPCLEIEKDSDSVYDYTNKGNLVGVISNGTAILGLGDLGAAASKPVMEGKGVLFKIFAGIDGIDVKKFDRKLHRISLVGGCISSIPLDVHIPFADSELAILSHDPSTPLNHRRSSSSLSSNTLN